MRKLTMAEKREQANAKLARKLAADAQKREADPYTQATCNLDAADVQELDEILGGN